MGPVWIRPPCYMYQQPRGVAGLMGTTLEAKMVVTAHAMGEGPVIAGIGSLAGRLCDTRRGGYLFTSCEARNSLQQMENRAVLSVWVVSR